MEPEVIPPVKLSVAEFAAKIKEKYPAYKEQDDSTLVSAILKKYPQYAEQVDIQKKSLDQSTSVLPTLAPDSSPVPQPSAPDSQKTETSPIKEPDGFWSSLYKAARNSFSATVPAVDLADTFAKKTYSTLKHQIVPSTNLAIQTLINQGLKTVEYGAENTIGRIPGVAALDKAAPIPKPSDLHKFLLKDAVRYAGSESKNAEAMSNEFVNSYKNIKDVPDAAKWATGALAQTAAQIIPAILTGGASAAGQEIGSIYLESVKQIGEKMNITPEEVIDRNLDEPAIAIAGGLGAGALELIGAKGVAGAFSNSPVGRAFKSKMRSFFTNPVAKEVATEGAQTVVEHGSTALSAGVPLAEEFNKPETQQDIKESMAQAAIGGGAGVALGGATRGNLVESKEVKPSLINHLDQITADNTTIDDAAKIVTSAMPYMKGLSKIQLDTMINKGIADGSVVRDGNTIKFNSFDAAKGAVDYIKTHLAALPKYHPLVKSMGEAVLGQRDSSPVTEADLPVVKVKGSVEPVLVATTQDPEGNTIETHNTGLKNADTGQEMRVETIIDPQGNKTFQSEDGAIQGPSVEAVARQMQNSSLPQVTPLQVKKANEIIQVEGVSKPTLMKIYTEVFGFPEDVAKDFAETGARQITKLVKLNKDMTPEQAFDKLQSEPPKENTADENWKEILGEKSKPKENGNQNLQEGTTGTGLPVQEPGGKTVEPGSKEPGSTGSVDRKEEVRKDEVPKPVEEGKVDVTVKLFEKPDMENPVHKVTINGVDHFIQRANGSSPSDIAWFEVKKDDRGAWADVNKQGLHSSPMQSNIGYTKQEAIDHLTGKVISEKKTKENAVQKSEARKVGPHTGGDKTVGGTGEGKGVGRSQQGTKPAGENSKQDNTSQKASEEKVAPSQESMDVLDLLSGDIFPGTVKEFIDAMKEFDEYSGTLGQFKAMARLEQMQKEGLLSIEGNKIIPSFVKNGNEYVPQTEQQIVKVNSRRKKPFGLVDGANGFMFQTDLGDLWTGAKGIFKKYFHSKGALPQFVFDSWNKTRAETKVYEAKVRFLVNDLRAAMADEYGKIITEAQIIDINLALQSQITSQPIPPKTLDVIRKMRAEVDALSQRFIDEGIVSGPLAMKFTANKGIYLTRSFRKWDDASWKDEVPDQAYNIALGFLRSKYPGYNQDQLDGLINYLLYSPYSTMNILQGGTMNGMDLSVLKKRGKIDPAIRALMGEYSDPIVNFSRSIAKMADLVAKNHFQQEVLKDGLGVYLFKEQTGKYSYPIKQNPKKSAPTPLDGLFTTEDIAEAFEEFNGPQPNPWWAKPFIVGNAYVNFGLTVASPTTHSRNFFSNPFFALMNGHLRPSKLRAMRAAWENVAQTDNDGMRKMLLKYISLGIINDGVTVGVLKEYLNDIREGVNEFDPVSKTPANKLRKLPGRIKTGAEHLYQWGDNTWKIFAFENEVERYKKAYPSWTTEQVEAKAAKNVRNTYPTYSLIPKAGKLLKSIPAIGGFTSFPSEVVRTTFNTLELATQEMRSGNPQLAKYGRRRLAGVTSAMLVGTGLSYATRALLHMDGEDEDDLRKFVGPWQTDSEFLYLNHEGAKYTIVDLGAFDPHSYLKRPIYEALRGEYRSDGQHVMDIAKQIVGPFINEQVLTQRIIDLARDQTTLGKQIYNPDSPMGDQITDAVSYFFKGVSPGFAKSAINLKKAVKGVTDNSGKEYQLSHELLAIFPGARIQTIDVTESLKYKGFDFQKRLDQANSDFQKVDKSKSSTPEEKAAAKERLSATVTNIYGEATDIRDSAIRLGADPNVMNGVNFGKYFGLIKK